MEGIEANGAQRRVCWVQPRIHFRIRVVYNMAVIKTFGHKGLEAFFRTGSKAGIRPDHAGKLRLQLGALDRATQIDDMAAPGWRLHALKGALAGHYAITVNGNWRLTFRFVAGGDVELVDYQDYH